MPRKTTKSLERKVSPDRKYQSILVQRLINKSMLDGKKQAAERAVYEAIEKAAKELKSEGYAILLVEQTDNSVMLQDFDFSQYEKVALFVGNEVFGISDELLPLCDAAVEIPQFGTKHSLNVAVATGITLWEAVKQLAVRS